MQLGAAARGRLARHRHDGDRARRAADRAARKATRTTGSARLSSSSSPIVAAIALTLFVVDRADRRRSRCSTCGCCSAAISASASLANFLLGVALYGSVFILPVYLSRIQGYNAEQIGMVLAWTGLPQLVLIPLVPRLMKRSIARIVIGVGFALFAASNFMNIYMTADYATDQLFWPNVVRAVGQALVFAPLSAVATAGIEAENAGSASGLFNMMRNLGGAVGIALLQTLLTKREQYHSNVLTQSVSMFEQATRTQDRKADAVFHERRRRRSRRRFAPRRSSRSGKIVQKQAFILAFSDIFYLLGAGADRRARSPRYCSRSPEPS